MKRTTLLASTILVALAACEERTDVEREVALPAEGAEEADPTPLGDPGAADKPIGEPGEERSDVAEERRELEKARRELEEERRELDKDREKEPVAGTTGSEGKRSATVGEGGALSHMPQGCKGLLHAQASKLGELPGAKQHLMPAIEEVRRSNASVENTIAILKDGGIESAKDVDEMALCVIDAPTMAEARQGQQSMMKNTNIVIAMTGDFKQGELVPALLKRAGADAKELEIGGIEVFRDESRNLFIGQADDGTIIAAADRDAFSKAVSGDGDYDLPTKNAFALLLPEGTMQTLLDQFGDPAAKKLGADVERAIFTFDPDGDKLSLRIEMPDHTRAAELGGVFKARIAQWEAKAGETQDATERRFAEVLKNAETQYEEDVVILNVSVKDEQIESGMKNLAEQVRALK
jgi:hypothetical protein